MERSHYHDAGFSLVELAVVMVVMGIVIAGILKGQDLIESARLKRIIGQIHEYRVATHTFVDRYGSLPGDYTKASLVIDTRLTDGEGTGQISGDGLEPGGKALHFWSHLAMSGLITPPGKLEELNQPEFGKGAPQTSFGGGVTIQQDPDPSLHGLWFIVGNAYGQSGRGALFTPQQAVRILSQIDSAEPLVGRVQAREGADVGGQRCLSADGSFDMSHKQKTCVIFFQLG